jgi:sulfate adenylyltransferase subunit 2
MSDPLRRQPLRERVAHLDLLEAEAIHVIRETVACFERPVMLYSIGKDSTAMLHLARKAFWPGRVPFPILHIDTGWKFREMYAYRDAYVRGELGLELLVHRNEEAIAAGISTFTHGSRVHTDLLKTVALRQALDLHRFDAAFGGARRDEEKSRAKERVFSIRDANHRWDPRSQRPELWSLYNTRLAPGQSVRVFPLSNWTELDVWLYIRREALPVVPLYFAKPRPVVRRHGTLLLVDDNRLPLEPGERPELRTVRFRTLGCYPLTGAIESDAETLDEVILELVASEFSERQGRLIDHDAVGSMEEKKREGYF